MDLRRFLGISAGIARGGGRACAQRAAEEPFSIHPRLSATFLTNRATAIRQRRSRDRLAPLSQTTEPRPPDGF